MAYFPTWKGGRRMERLRHYFYEDMAVLLEADPAVLSWTAEPGPLDLEHDDGEVRPFTCTFRAETEDYSRLIKLNDDARKLKLGRKPKRHPRRPRPLQAPDLVCEYYTCSALAQHPRLRTSRDILFHRPRYWARELPYRIATMAALEHPATLGEIHRRLASPEVAFEDLVSLVAQGYIEVDLDFPVGPEMPVLSCNARGYLG